MGQPCVCGACVCVCVCVVRRPGGGEGCRALRSAEHLTAPLPRTAKWSTARAGLQLPRRHGRSGCTRAAQWAAIGPGGQGRPAEVSAERPGAALAPDEAVHVRPAGGDRRQARHRRPLQRLVGDTPQAHTYPPTTPSHLYAPTHPSASARLVLHNLTTAELDGPATAHCDSAHDCRRRRVGGPPRYLQPARNTQGPSSRPFWASLEPLLATHHRPTDRPISPFPFVSLICWPSARRRFALIVQACG